MSEVKEEYCEVKPRAASPEPVPKKKFSPCAEEPLEFGGPRGVVLIMIFSHFLVIYLFVALEAHDGALFWDLSTALEVVCDKALPTAESIFVYGAFILFQAVLGVAVPGFVQQGQPLDFLKGERLTYNCNAFGCWWITLFSAGALHYTGAFPLQRVSELRGALMTTSMLFADALALACYVGEHNP